MEIGEEEVGEEGDEEVELARDEDEEDEVEVAKGEEGNEKRLEEACASGCGTRDEIANWAACGSANLRSCDKRWLSWSSQLSLGV